QQRLMGARIQPGHSSAQLLHPQRTTLEVPPIDIGDLELPARGGLQSSRDVEHLVVVEIESRHRKVRLGIFGLLLDVEGPSRLVELNDSIPLGVPHAVGEYRRALAALRCRLELLRQTLAIENVVPEYEGDALIADEPAADDERLGQTFRPRLLRIGKRDSPLGAIAEQPPKERQILRGGDEQNVPDARQHQCCQGIVDHWLVVDRQELLADAEGYGVQPGTRATGQNDTFQVLDSSDDLQLELATIMPDCVLGMLHESPGCPRMPDGP